MKISIIVGAFLASTLMGVQAQMANTPTAGQSTATPTALPANTAYQVVDIEPNQNVWQRQTYATDASGQVVTNVQQYTELAAGLNYQDVNGNWMPAQEVIESYSQGAIARQGRYQVIFANNLNSPGSIDVQTPDSKRLVSNILGLGYYDNSTGQSVLFAQIQDSQGAQISANQVLYTNAFSGVKADVRYTYKKGRFEQDVILRQQPPTPESLGLNSSTTEIQVLTEFINPPEATVMDEVNTDGDAEPDDRAISWGQMCVGRGRAFALGDERDSTRVYVKKHYVTVDGRTILIESIPLLNIQAQLKNLSAQVQPITKSPMMASKQVPLPGSPMGKLFGKPIQMASASPADKGFVLDYVQIVADQVNYTFQSDTTYLVSGEFSLQGNIVFEGGTVIKYGGSGELDILLHSSPATAVSWLSSPYRPIVMTGLDDDSVGEQISGSSGNPTGNYYGSYIVSELDVPFPTISNFRVCYASCGFSVQFPKFFDGQFVSCYNAIQLDYGPSVPVYLRNILFADMGNECLPAIYAGSVNLQNVTFANDASPIADFGGYAYSLKFTNCILANISAPFDGYEVASGADNGFYDSPAFGSGAVTNTSYPFQTVGAGNFYLASGCAFTNAGTTNIDATLLLDLGKKTTCPPILYSNLTFTTNVTLTPQAVRDTNASLNLGYHYDPIDYLCGNVNVTNATMTVNPGTVISGFAAGPDYGYSLQFENGSQFFCQGQPNHPNWIVEYSTVQEGPPNTNWVSYFLTPFSYTLVVDSTSSTASAINCRFTDWSSMWQDVAHIFQANNDGPALFRDCQFQGGFMGMESYGLLDMTNCLIDRVNFSVQPSYGNFPIIYNLTMHGGEFNLIVSGNSTNILIQDSLFDQVMPSIKDYTNICYNAYVTNSTMTYSGYFLHTGDLTLSASPAYKVGVFGNYYLPAGSPLINSGSTTADQLGIYHYTTQTNQTVEGFSIVDIGYHYVASDANGNPLDSNGNGIPDYLEDASGHGQPLTVTLTLPTNNVFYKEPATIPMQATVFDWSSVVTNVSFLNGTIQITATTNAPYQYTWPVVAAGLYSVTATAQDIAGSTTNSAAATVTVTNLCGY